MRDSLVDLRQVCSRVLAPLTLRVLIYVGLPMRTGWTVAAGFVEKVREVVVGFSAIGMQFKCGTRLDDFGNAPGSR